MRRGRRAAAAVAAALVVVLVAAGVVVLLRSRDDSSCAPEHRVGGADVPAVFSTGAAPAGTDGRLAELVRAARGWRLGTVVGALGFDYGHFLTLAGLPDGLVAWTRDNRDVAFLDTALAPRWGIAQDRGQHAWDADTDTWYQLRLASRSPMQVTARRLRDGAARWCASVGTVPTRYGDAFATAPLGSGDVLVLARTAGGSVLARLRGSDGHASWRRQLARLRDGSALVRFGSHAVVGGRASYDLTDFGHDRLTALDPATGRPAWSWTAAGPAHVLGSAGDHLLLEERYRGGLVLVALDAVGRPAWRRPLPAGSTPDLALRSGTVVVRTPRSLVGLAASTGRRRWTAAVPARPQYFPYGFQLDAQPQLDTTHLLMGTTTALVSLDLATGARSAYRLPVHGIDTTYWPYQVVVTPEMLAVVTNTGGVVLRR